MSLVPLIIHCPPVCSFWKQDIDSDEEWQDLVKTTDPGNMTSATFDQSILPRLKSRLLTSKFQVKKGFFNYKLILR